MSDTDSDTSSYPVSCKVLMWNDSYFVDEASRPGIGEGQRGIEMDLREELQAVCSLEMQVYMTSWQCSVCCSVERISAALRFPWLICSDILHAPGWTVNHQEKRVWTKEILNYSPKSLPSCIARTNQDGFVKKFVHTGNKLWKTTNMSGKMALTNEIQNIIF